MLRFSCVYSPLPMTLLLKARALHKTYRSAAKTHSVLDGVDLDLDGGEMVALLGRSGSGKSTLLNLLAGIDRPDSGDIWFGDMLFTGLDEKSRTMLRRRRVGFVFQFFNLLDSLTALENVALPLELDGVSASLAGRRALDVLRQVGLSSQAQAYPDQLSGGEQQRIAIARALVNEPEILFADEPTGNLDADSGRKLLQLLSGFIDSSRTILVASHSLEVAHSASRILTLESGRLCEREGGFAW